MAHIVLEIREDRNAIGNLSVRMGIAFGCFQPFIHVAFRVEILPCQQGLQSVFLFVHPENWLLFTIAALFYFA